MAGEQNEAGVLIEQPVASLTTEKVKLESGQFTRTFLDRYPAIEAVPGVFTDVFVTNPGREKALIALAGYSKGHTDEFLGDDAKTIAGNTSDTLITVGWSEMSDVTDLRWRLLADYLKKNNHTEVELFGTSFGGRECLIGLKKLKQLSEEGFDIPVKSVVVAVAPVNKESIQSRKTMGNKNWLMLQAVRRLEPVITSVSTLFPALRAEIVRVRELVQGEQFKKGDFQEGQVVHYLGTDREGNLDPLVNQPEAIAELRNMGVEVHEQWYKPNPEFAHTPAVEDRGRLVNDGLAILNGINTPQLI